MPTILAERLDEARKELDKLVRRANRYGGEISYTVGAPYIQERTIEDWDGGIRKVRVQVVDINTVGEAPRVGDYTFLARIDHPQGMANMVMVHPDYEGQVDKKWWHAASGCEHCRRDRKRADTFIVRHNVHLHQLQVGRTCLRDFLGIDNPELIIRKFETIKRFNDFSESYGRMEWAHATLEILEVTACLVRTKGWCPKSAANDETPSTSSIVDVVLDDKKVKNEWRQFVKENITDADRKLAEDTLGWLRNVLSPTSTYDHNLKVVGLSDVLTDRRYLGILVSSVSAYCKTIARELAYAQRKAVAAKSEWLGQEGQRLRQIKVRQEMARAIAGGYYGDSILYKFVTEKGEVLTWITGSGTDRHNGDEFLIDASVKKHSEYQGAKETLLTRVKVFA